MKKGRQLIQCILGLSMAIFILTSVSANDQNVDDLKLGDDQENKNMSETVTIDNDITKKTFTFDESADIPINESAFPDTSFREYLRKEYDSDKNGSLSQSERTISSLSVIDLGIETLEGIQYFPYIKILKCSGNQLTELNLNQNTLIETLACSRNNFNNIDVSYLSQLKGFTCDDTPLQTIQLPKSIKTLSLSNTQLSLLDLSLCDQLSQLTLENIPKLEQLQLYKGLSFHYFKCQQTGLKSLDLSYTTCTAKDFWLDNNPYLTDVQLDNSSFKILHMNHCNLQKLDVSQATITELLQVNNNIQLSEIELPKTVFSAKIYAYRCQLESIDLSHVHTSEVWINENATLSKITLGNDTIIEKLYAHKCVQLTHLDISLAQIKKLWLTDNQKLSHLNTGSNTVLDSLFCRGCSLAHLNLLENTNLTTTSLTPQILETETIATIHLEQFYILLNDQVDLSKITHLSYGKLNVSEHKIEFDQLPEQDDITYTYETGMGNMEVTIPLYSPYHKVTLHTPGLEPQQTLVDEEGKYSLPSPPYKNGYVFEGWYYDQDYTNAYKNEVIKEDVVLYARYSKLYKVTFVNGDYKMSKEFRGGQFINKIGVPDKNGYHFIGWFLADGATQWNFEKDKVYEDIVLYARFQKIDDEMIDNEVPSQQTNKPIIQPLPEDKDIRNESSIHQKNTVKTSDSIPIYNSVIAIIFAMGIIWMNQKHWRNRRGEKK